LLGDQRGVLFLESVGDVLEEDKAKHNVLVLGRVHVVAQLIGRLPQRLLEPERRSVVTVVVIRPSFPDANHSETLSINERYTGGSWAASAPVRKS
jgi:hypothetical protein